MPVLSTLGSASVKAYGATLVVGSTEAATDPATTNDITQPVNTDYDVANLSYDNQTIDLTGWATLPEGVNFKPDGTELYTMDRNNRQLRQYSLSVPFDLASATLTHTTSAMSITGSNIEIDMHVADDGTYGWVIIGCLTGSTNSGLIVSYRLSTPWDLSTINGTTPFATKTWGFRVGQMFWTPNGTTVFLSDETDERCRLHC